MSNIVQVPADSNNYTVGRLGYRISGVIIHTMVGTLGSADATFANPARGASAHHGVACDGSVVHQYVSESNIAWHCGRFYPDAANPLANANTVGIEHCDNGDAFAPRSDAEYACSAQLVREICARYGIPIDRTHIRKHTEVSVLYTGCPDTLDIDRIVRQAASGSPTPPAPRPTGDDDMLYTSTKMHPLSGTLRVFAAGAAYRDPSTSSLQTGPLAVGATIGVDGYVYSSSYIDDSSQGATVSNHVWWHATSGQWVSDAILDTQGLAGAPAPAVPANEPLSSYFAIAGQGGGGVDDDSQYATKADLQAVKDAIPTKAIGSVTLPLGK